MMKGPCQFVILLTCAVVASAAAGQELLNSPLGVVVIPKKPIKPPPELRRLLPRGIAIRILAETRLAPDGETLVVYDRHPGTPEPYAHVAFVRSEKVLKDYALDQLIEYGEGFNAMCFSSFHARGDQEAVAIAFRGTGDGAGSLFAVLTADEMSYQVVFLRRVSQGRLKIFEGETPRLELWSAADDLSPTTALAADNKTPIVHLMSVVWGRHRYQVETYEWREGKFVRVSKWKTKKFYHPARMAARPLVLVKQAPQASPGPAEDRNR